MAKSKNKITILLTVIFSILLSACGAARTVEPPAVPTETQLPTALVEQAALPTVEVPVQTPEPDTLPTPIPLPPNRTHYQLDVDLDYYSRYLDVKERITYTNKTGKALESILIHNPVKFYPGAYTERFFGGDLVASTTDEGLTTIVQLTRPLEPGEIVVLSFSFRVVVPELQGIFGYTNRQLNLSNWYPYIPYYDPEKGWLVYDEVIVDNIVVGEHIVNETSDFDVNFVTTNHANLIEVAASAPAIGEPKSGVYSYHLEGARAFAFSISDSYFIEEIEQDGVRIQSYTFMNHYEQGVGKAAVEIGARALKLYGELFFPYDRELLTIVAGDFLHNMEMDGMVLISNRVIDFYDDTAENNLTILVPHELSHQWFYSQVGSNYAMEPWLDEAIATYSESLFYERYHPELSDWWWDNRVYAHPHEGYVNNSIYDAGSYENYRSSVYLRGAIFLHDLRITMGDQAFLSAIKNYVAQNNLKIATKNEFIAEFQAANPTVDLQPVFNRYFKE